MGVPGARPLTSLISRWTLGDSVSSLVSKRSVESDLGTPLVSASAVNICECVHTQTQMHTHREVCRKHVIRTE